MENPKKLIDEIQELLSHASTKGIELDDDYKNNSAPRTIQELEDIVSTLKYEIARLETNPESNTSKIRSSSELRMGLTKSNTDLFNSAHSALMYPLDFIGSHQTQGSSVSKLVEEETGLFACFKENGYDILEQRKVVKALIEKAKQQGATVDPSYFDFDTVVMPHVLSDYIEALGYEIEKISNNPAEKNIDSVDVALRRKLSPIEAEYRELARYAQQLGLSFTFNSHVNVSSAEQDVKTLKNLIQENGFLQKAEYEAYLTTLIEDAKKQGFEVPSQFFDDVSNPRKLMDRISTIKYSLENPNPSKTIYSLSGLQTKLYSQYVNLLKEAKDYGLETKAMPKCTKETNVSELLEVVEQLKTQIENESSGIQPQN